MIDAVRRLRTSPSALFVGLTLAIATVLGLPDPAYSIIMRHDQPDSAYRALGKGHDAVAYTAAGVGVLIAPEWVLTAAHVAELLQHENRSVHIGGERYTADELTFHPTWEGMPSEKSTDMALVKLDRAVSDITPVKLYADSNEVGMEVLFVGKGDVGNGKSGPGRSDGVIRGANNVVEGFFADYLVFNFDGPGEALEFEGISGPGDSGGPALFLREGELYTLGVSSGNTGDPICRYDTHELYARVSTNREWIETTIDQAEDQPLE